jgi:hypothetical protein
LQPIGEGGLIDGAAVPLVLVMICETIGSSPMGGGGWSFFHG